MDTYKIKVLSSEGPEVGTENGTIVGPFGVSEDKTNGTYRVTHLHSGLLMSPLCSSDRRNCLSAAKELARRVPWWKSHKTARIAEENGLAEHELKKQVDESAKMFDCEGLQKDD